MLRTRAPVADRSIATPSLPLDLHVLSLSLAFILSQDQTLHCTFFIFFEMSSDFRPIPLPQDLLNVIFVFLLTERIIFRKSYLVALYI